MGSDSAQLATMGDKAAQLAPFFEKADLGTLRKHALLRGIHVNQSRKKLIAAILKKNPQILAISA
eukprot:11656374-Karenia_brevis.AAC.1